MNPVHNPEHELAMRLAAYRMAVQDPDVFTTPAPTPDEQEEARRIAHAIRLSVKVEAAARSARLALWGLAWVMAGTVLNMVFNTIFDVPVLVMVGSVCTLIGLGMMISTLAVQHVEHKKQNQQYSPRVLAAVKAHHRAENRHRRAHLKARVSAATRRFRGER